MVTLVHGDVRWGVRGTPVPECLDAVRRPLRQLPSASALPPQIEETPSWALMSQSHAPQSALLQSPDGLAIAANVRLDDRAGLATALGVTTEGLAELSDTALLLEGYRRRGVDLAPLILGDGVFLLWDDRRKRLMCWRDAAGARPLYYHYSAEVGIVASSDLRSISSHPHVAPRMDLAYANGLLRSGGSFQAPDRTLIEGVNKLPAGHILIVNENGPRLHRYWAAEDVKSDHGRDPREYVEELRSLLQQAISCRIDDGASTVASHLSGGLDSSSIAVLAHRSASEQGREVLGFSWAPSYDRVARLDTDERPLVESVSSAESIELHYADVKASDLLDHEARDVAVRPVTTMHFELGTSRQAVAAGAQTLLSGWGGDELIVNNGRGYFADLAYRGHWRTLNRELRLRTRIHGGSFRSMLTGRVAKPLLSDSLLYRFRPDDRPSDLDLPDCLNPDFRSALNSVEPLRMPPIRERRGVRPFQIAKLEHGHLQYRMEAWAGLGADVGLQYAYPLLDRRIIEFALSIPDDLYFKNGWKRWLYRTAMEGILPDNVRWHPDKEDPAMSRMLNDVLATTRTDLSALIREQANNPFVDTSEMLVDWDSKRRPEPGPIGPAPSRYAMWLPFTGLSLP